MKKNVLVTGADGFIGSHLTEKLVSKGFNVTAFCSYNSFSNPGWLKHLNPKIKKKINIIFGDIRDDSIFRNLLKKNKIIFHLAALIGIPYSYDAPKSYVDTNIIGTLNLLNAAKETDVEKILITSTSEVYGSGQYFPMDERHPLVAQSPYSATKIAADKLAQSYYASFGTPILIIRPFNAFGPRQSRRAVVPSIIYQALKNHRIKLGNQFAERDFNFVDDIIEGYYLASTSKTDKFLGHEFNISSGYSISILEITKLIGKILNKKLIIETDKIRFRPKKSEVNKLLGCSKKAGKILGWKPKLSGKIKLAAGIKKTIDWYSDKENMKVFADNSYEK
tara:strand:+ start:474 stop:1478 length:1005 start_codon:yes stop_codon:yes gene_type:complete